MGWDNAPTAIDGTQLQGEDLRRGLYATSKSQGIAGVGDLKVLPLSVPGNGFRVSPGSALVYNKYVTPIRESYSVGAPTEDIFGSGGMPASIGSPRSHLVAVMVGDPQYSNAGHPYFPATFPGLNDPLTYQYTRTWLFQNVPAGSGQAWLDANVPYPALALARLDVPASTTTIQASHIVDLRTMANPRTLDVQWNQAVVGADVLAVVTAFTYKPWPAAAAKAIDIPSWATKCYVDAYIYGFVQGGGAAIVDAAMRVGINGGSVGAQSVFYSPVAEAAGRKLVLLGAPIAISAAERGTTKTFEIQATYSNTSMNNALATDTRTSASVHLRFAEEAV